MEVSILILNYNGKDIMKVSLDSIKKLELKFSHEVIVIDNASTDGSQKFVKENYPWVKLIQNKTNMGYPGLNEGVPESKGEFILFLNNDLEIEEGAIEKLLEFLKTHEEAAFCAPRIMNYYDKTKSESQGGTWVSRSFYAGCIDGDIPEKPIEIPYLGVGLIRKKVIDIVGYLLDPDYFLYSEDLDLGLRLRLAGYKVYFVPEAVIYHMHAATTSRFPSSRLTFLMERNLLTTYIKVCNWKSFAVLLPYVTFMRCMAILKDLVKFNFKGSFARVKAVFWVVFHLRKIYSKRKEVQSFRKIGDKEFFKIFSEKYLF